MITVVHIITKLEMGGAQENTLYTCEHLDRTKYRVVLIHGSGGYLDHAAYSMPNTEVISLESLVREIAPKRDADCLRRLTLLLRKYKRRGPVILHTHSSKAGILGRIAGQLAGIKPIIHSIHGFSFHEGQKFVLNKTYVAAEIATGKMTDGFIGVSQANLDEATEKGIIRPYHRIALVRSGFDIDDFYEQSRNSTEDVRQEFAVPEDHELIVTIANLKPQKDPLTMVRAVAELRKRRPKVVILYAGDGPLRSEVEAEISRLGLQDYFKLIGWRQDVPKLMGAADIVALSSIFEGLPRVAVQAVVARKPFVGTHVDGTPEIIRSGKNGFLVPSRNPLLLSEALQKGLELRPVDPEDESRVRAWDADEMVRSQERFYEELSHNLG